MTLASHTWWDGSHVLAGSVLLGVGLLIGLVVGAFFLGTRMVRVHSHGGFHFIAAILHRHRRPPHLAEVQVAFDPELATERNRQMAQLRVMDDDEGEHPTSGGDGD